MLEGHDIIYFSNDWNADNRTSSHHIAKRLARSNRLLYIEASGLRSPSSSLHDIKRIVRKIKRFLKGPQQLNSKIYIYTPVLLPFHRFRVIRKLNKFLLIKSLRLVCRKLKFKNPILWIIIPHMSVVIGKLSEKLVVYWCVDDFSSLPGVESGIVSWFDSQITKKADIIFTPSQPLYLKKKKINPNTYLTPHGVDFEHFSKAVDKNLTIPEDIKAIKKPIIGFFGLIESRIDLELIKYIAKSKPHWSIVLIGRVAQNIEAFKDIDNVYFLGPREYEILPSYGKTFDVAIIPYVLNSKFAFNANPIKLREYLAMGKPVVAVRTPEIEKFSDVVKIADSYQDFVDNIEVALKEDSEEKIKQRVEKVRNSSWEKRFGEIAGIVNSILKQKDTYKMKTYLRG
ncbi:MAG: glycosyltransferase family 1 protein, partial [Candidatus Omnitrophota bacterium]